MQRFGSWRRGIDVQFAFQPILSCINKRLEFERPSPLLFYECLLCFMSAYPAAHTLSGGWKHQLIRNRILVLLSWCFTAYPTISPGVAPIMPRSIKHYAWASSKQLKRILSVETSLHIRAIPNWWSIRLRVSAQRSTIIWGHTEIVSSPVSASPPIEVKRVLDLL